MRGISMKLQLVALAAIGLTTATAAASTQPLALYFVSGNTTSVTYAGTGSAGFTGTQLIGGFDVSAFEVTTNQPDTPTPSSAGLSGLSLNVQNKGTSQATIDVYVSDNAFTFPAVGANTGKLTLNGQINSFSVSGVSNTDNVVFSEYADPSGTQFGLTAFSATNTTTFSNGTQVSSYPGVTASVNFTPNYPTPYAITDVFAITLSPSAQTTFTFENSVVPDTSSTPEPASLGLMGLAGVGALLVGRRRKA